jgi:hypothetical protein
LFCAETVEEGAAVVNVKVDCRGIVPIAAIDGENEHVTPTGKLPQVKDTLPL